MPADDLVLNVRQVAGYPDGGAAVASDAVLIQRGGLGGPYLSLDAQALVSTALETGGPLGVGVAPPSSPYPNQILTGWLCGDGLAFNAYLDSTPAWRALNPGASAFINLTTVDAFRFDVGGTAASGQLVAPITTAMSLTYGGELAVAGQVSVGRDPVAPNELVTVNYLGATMAASVRSFNGRFGNVMLTVDDIICAGGAPIFSPYFQGEPRASTPPPWSNSSRVATTAFVQMALAAHGDITGYAPIDSPNFTGVPTAPTAPLGASDGQIATTAFVQNAVTESTTGVVSFNSRAGAVVLTSADLSSVGGALLASPTFTGAPQAPTVAPGDSSARIATTAFVAAAIAAVGAGVTSFNGRAGLVTLTATDVSSVAVGTFNGRIGAVNLIANDISAAGGALLAGPAFTGSPSAPTAAPGSNSTQLATTAFVTAAIAAGAAGVASFNTRTGAVTLTAGDVSGVGGALLASPAFTGVPSAPTAAPATSTTQLATCAFVAAAIAALGASVSSFNSRTGAITLIANDLSGAGGALLASPIFTGTPAGPTAAPGVSTTQLATTAYVMAAIAPLATTASLANYLPLSGGTLTGALTPAAAGIVGVTTVSNAPAGAVGEVLFTVISVGVNAPTATTINVGSLVLSAGDWDISGEVWFSLTGVGSIVGAGLTTIGTTLPGAPGQNASRSQLNFSGGASGLGGGFQILPLSMMRTVQSATFTLFLVASATFSSGACTVTGKILARRAR